MTLFRHEMRRAWKSLLIWTAAISGMLALDMLLFPMMKTMAGELDAMLASMGDDMARAAGLAGMNMLRVGDYYASQISSVLGLGGGIFAALLGIGALAKEERNGTAEFLLTHPLSRSGVVTSKLAAVLLQVLVLNLGAFLLAVLSTLAIGEVMPWRLYLSLHLAHLLMTTQIACMCFGLSALMRRGGVAIALGLVFLMYFLSLVAALVGSRQEIAGNVLNAVTPFGYSSGSEILARGGLNPVWTAVGVALTACGIALAYVVYRRKDIR